MSDYYTILTPVGIAELVNARAANVTVPITHMGIGDGGGAPVKPAETMLTMVREVYRVPISSITQHPTNPAWLVVEAVLPAAVGGFTVRETSLLGGVGAGGKTLALGNFPESYKPLLAENTSTDMIIKMIIQVSNSAVISLTVDPSVALATNQSIANAIAAHLLAVNPHPQYALAADLAQHILALDPHPQYLKSSALTAYLTQIQVQALIDGLNLKINNKADSGLMGLALFNQGHI
jgi:phage-related tail fiber protein